VGDRRKQERQLQRVYKWSSRGIISHRTEKIETMEGTYLPFLLGLLLVHPAGTYAICRVIETANAIIPKLPATLMSLEVLHYPVEFDFASSRHVVYVSKYMRISVQYTGFRYLLHPAPCPSSAVIGKGAAMYGAALAGLGNL
jgi:hypothetical protein